MVKIVSGNLLDSKAEALVNTVNTVGVMGKGIALQFKQAFPQNYDAYRKAAKRKEIQPGKMFIYSTNRLDGPRFIINFPTKRHWKGKARIEDIDAGLKDLVNVVREKHIGSIAVPPLGCGNGGLNWNDVRPRIIKALCALEDVNVYVFEPKGAPASDQMKVGTKPPPMTVHRAALLLLLHRYIVPPYRLTLLEIQKLAYFLQVAGEPLRLAFVKHQYGPYAEKLQFVLQRFEGHFIRGYGDRSSESSIAIVPEAISEAHELLKRNPESLDRTERVTKLIRGFETPYGMELLGTIHWLGMEDDKIKDHSDTAIEAVHSWTTRKKETFDPHHIRVAWERLREQNWFDTTDSQ